jgi:hypothetical protein
LLDAKQKQQKDLQDQQQKLMEALNQLCMKLGGLSYAQYTCSTDPTFGLGTWPWGTADSTQVWSPNKPSQNASVAKLEAQLASVVSQLEKIGSTPDSKMWLQSEIKDATDKVAYFTKLLSKACQKTYHSTLKPDDIENNTSYSLEAGCSVFPKKIIWSDSQPDPDAKLLQAQLKALSPSPLPEKWILAGAVGIVLLIGLIVVIANSV